MANEDRARWCRIAEQGFTAAEIKPLRVMFAVLARWQASGEVGDRELAFWLSANWVLREKARSGMKGIVLICAAWRCWCATRGPYAMKLTVSPGDVFDRVVWPALVWASVRIRAEPEDAFAEAERVHWLADKYGDVGMLAARLSPNLYSSRRAGMIEVEMGKLQAHMRSWNGTRSNRKGYSAEVQRVVIPLELSRAERRDAGNPVHGMVKSETTAGGALKRDGGAM